MGKMSGTVLEGASTGDAVDTICDETPAGPRITVRSAGSETAFSLDVEGARTLALRLLQFVMKTEADSRPPR